jgi:hypothetical protein
LITTKTNENMGLLLKKRGDWAIIRETLLQYPHSIKAGD